HRYAYADEEFFQGDVNVAAAILNEDSQPIAAVNISVPKPRWTLERARQDLAPLVIRAARAISKNAA
ncbi:IclR family transcriptional regulator, partial [Pseudomonas stutzeri]|nr:IclR family transcriptional regulator [Stutzerimonas stutzeri]